MLQVVPLNVPPPNSIRPTPMLPASVMRGHRVGAACADVGARGDDVAGAREDVGPLRQRRGRNARHRDRRRLGNARGRGREQGAQLGLGDAGERDQRLHRLRRIARLLARRGAAPCAALARVSAALARRLEAGSHAELGQARRFGARRGVEARLREPRFAGAQGDVLVRGLGRDDDARVVPSRRAPSSRASAASRAARLPPKTSSSQLACRPAPALVPIGRLRSWRPRTALAVASSAGRARRRRRCGAPALRRCALPALATVGLAVSAASIRRASSGSSNCVHQRRSSAIVPSCGSGACHPGAIASACGGAPLGRRAAGEKRAR